MANDKAIELKSKLIKIRKSINDINKLGFDTIYIETKLRVIFDKLDNKTNETINKINCYTNYSEALKDLIELEEICDKYNIYFRLNNYYLYLNEIKLTKDNIPEIVKEVKTLLKELKNSSNMLYEQEQNIIENFYKGVYKVIKEELLLNFSELFDYCHNNDIDSSYIGEEIKNEIESIDLDKYPEIKIKLYSLLKKGLNVNLLDIDLLNAIIYKDKKTELESLVVNQTKELIRKINSNEETIKNYSDNKGELTSKINENKAYLNKYRKIIIKRIISFILSGTVVIASYKELFNILKSSDNFYSKTYKIYTEEYNSYTDEITTEESKITNPYDTKDIVKLNSYGNIINGVVADYRIRCIYDLSSLNYENIEDYKNYYLSHLNTLNPTSKNDINLSTQNHPIYDNVEYFDITRSFIDMASVEKTFDFSIAVMLCSIISFIIFGILLLILAHIGIFNETYVLENIKKLNLKNKQDILKLNQINKELLSIVDANEELKNKFNLELQKYPTLIEKMQKELSVISQKEESNNLKKI